MPNPIYTEPRTQFVIFYDPLTMTDKELSECHIDKKDGLYYFLYPEVINKKNPPKPIDLSKVMIQFWSKNSYQIMSREEYELKFQPVETVKSDSRIEAAHKHHKTGEY